MIKYILIVFLFHCSIFNNEEKDSSLQKEPAKLDIKSTQKLEKRNTEHKIEQLGTNIYYSNFDLNDSEFFKKNFNSIIQREDEKKTIIEIVNVINRCILDKNIYCLVVRLDEIFVNEIYFSINHIFPSKNKHTMKILTKEDLARQENIRHDVVNLRNITDTGLDSVIKSKKMEYLIMDLGRDENGVGFTLYIGNGKLKVKDYFKKQFHEDEFEKNNPDLPSSSYGYTLHILKEEGSEFVIDGFDAVDFLQPNDYKDHPPVMSNPNWFYDAIIKGYKVCSFEDCKKYKEYYEKSNQINKK